MSDKYNLKKRLLINSLVALPPTSGVRGVVVVVVVVLVVVDGVPVQFCICKVNVFISRRVS